MDAIGSLWSGSPQAAKKLQALPNLHFSYSLQAGEAKAAKTAKPTAVQSWTRPRLTCTGASQSPAKCSKPQIISFPGHCQNNRSNWPRPRSKGFPMPCRSLSILPALAFVALSPFSLGQLHAEEEAKPAEAAKSEEKAKEEGQAQNERPTLALCPAAARARAAAFASAAFLAIVPPRIWALSATTGILAINGTGVNNTRELSDALASVKVGEDVTVQWQRNDEVMEDTKAIKAMPARFAQTQELRERSQAIRELQAERTELMGTQALAKSLQDLTSVLQALPGQLDDTAKKFKEISGWHLHRAIDHRHPHQRRRPQRHRSRLGLGRRKVAKTKSEEGSAEESPKESEEKAEEASLHISSEEP